MSGPERRGRGKRTRPEDVNAYPAPSMYTLSPTTPSSQSFTPYPRHATTHSNQASHFQGSATNTAGLAGSYREPAVVRPPEKVAIPPLRTPHAGETSPKDRKKGRTSHACETCRKAKAGCTGGQPCLRCRNTHVPCIYGDGKRDKERKIMTQLSKKTESLNQHNLNVTEALRQIALDNSLSREGLKAAINAVLAMSPAQTPPSKSFEHRPSVSNHSDEQDNCEGSGENDVDAEVGSIESLDAVNVDTDRDDTRGTGHLGKTSAVAWAKRTTEECRGDSKDGPLQAQSAPDLTSLSYFTEDADLDFVDTSNVNMLDLPDEALSDMLLQTYFDHVHNALPIIDRYKFISLYKVFDRGSRHISSDDKAWLAQLNAVFAIAAIFLHFTKSRHRSHHHDHLIYCARARMLCMSEESLFEDAKVSSICALGLLCLYYLATCRLNKAFTICGLAMRNAVALGLHMRCQVDSLPDADKEHRVRVWWSLYSLECWLNHFTGRPTCILDRDISTALPVNVDEREFRQRQHLYKEEKDDDKPDSATYEGPTGSTDPETSFPALKLPITSSSYFILRVELAIVTHEIITNLYCAAVSKEKWNEVEATIHRIDERLLRWRDRLPDEFDITFDTLSRLNWNDPYTTQRIGLAMMFYSARMTLFRPCLCQFGGRIKQQSEKSKDFNQDAAEDCIQAARSMINLLVWNATNAEKIYTIFPWWITLHHLCEALSVLMLEMAFRSSHLPDQAGPILTDAKRGITWLILMAEQSISARKAWEIYDSLMRLVAPRIKHSVQDMPVEAPIPPGYNWRRFQPVQAFTTQSQQPYPGTNFEQFQASASLVSMANTVGSAPMAWSDPQAHMPYTTAEYPAYAQLAANPLDEAVALQRFSEIGQLHGHFDDPWQHMFYMGAPVQNMSMVAQDMMDTQMGPAPEMMVGGANGVAQEAYYSTADYPIYSQNHDFMGLHYGDSDEAPRGGR